MVREVHVHGEFLFNMTYFVVVAMITNKLP